MKNNKFNNVYLKVDKWQTAGEDVQYAFRFEGERLYVIFECTNGNKDWKNNFDFFTKPYKNMNETFYVHRGFAKLYHSIRDSLIYTIKKLIEIWSIKEICVVGYSQGSAIGTLFIEDLGFQIPTIKVSSYLYGCPMVLWRPSQSIKKRFENVYRISNKNDLVTKVPFSALGFEHVGSEYINTNNSIFWSPKWHIPQEYSKSEV